MCAGAATGILFGLFLGSTLTGSRECVFGGSWRAHSLRPSSLAIEGGETNLEPV